MKFSIEADPRVQAMMSEALKAVEDLKKNGIRRLIEARSKELTANKEQALGDKVSVRAASGREGVHRTMYGIPTGPGVPTIPDLDARILAIIDDGTEQGAPEFEMALWHSAGRDRVNVPSSQSDWGQYLGATPAWCGTAHCLAGWAIHLAGIDGYALADATDDEAAGAAIFLKSTGTVPYFYGSNEDALRQMRERVLAAARKRYAPEK